MCMIVSVSFSEKRHEQLFQFFQAKLKLTFIIFEINYELML